MTVLALSGLVDRPRKAAAAHGPVVRSTSVQALQEWELVQRAQQLDQHALTSLYQLYYPKVYNYALLQLGDVQQSEDVASDVMLKVLESLKAYRFKGVPFAAWVFRIARNRLIDLHRKKRRRGEVDLDEAMAVNRENPQAMAERALNRGQLQMALQQLTEEQRQVIVLKFIEGFDNAAVAKVLRRSEGAVKSLQHRALLSLRRILCQEEV